MKIKGLVLGTAAGALAVTGAQAADLPVAPEPIDYVRVCDAFGPGYYFIPGTDTCLRVAGRIRTDYNYFAANKSWNLLNGGGPGGIGTSFRNSNAYRFRARAYVYMDSRTNTEFGLLRTYTEIQGQLNSGQGTNTNLRLWRAFIQFGGLTFGRVQSFYDFLPPNFAQFFNTGYSDTSTLAAAYTFAFGNGFSASLSLETEENRRSGIVSITPGTPGGYEGNRIPDIVGALRVDQGWGSAQLMGALHQVNPFASNVDAEYGWAIGAGVDFNIPFGTGTSFNLQGGYTQGALAYVAGTPTGGAIFGSPTTPSFGVSTAVDAAIVNNQLELVNAFSINGSLATSFTPTISWVGSVGYVNVDHDDAVLGGDFDNWGAEGTIAYSPVSGMVFALGAQYQYVNVDDGAAIPGAFDDPQALSVFFRAQRTF